MQRGFTNLTPIYFFSSVREGSGKSSIVANTSIYLCSLSYKVAVIDFDYTSPEKLRRAFPKSIEVKDYQELTELVSSKSPRFQQNFYFTDTNKLSYFPAHQIKTPYELASDTAFRDFFLQLSSTFDYVLINLAPGVKESAVISDLLSKSYLWRGCKPASIIISLPDEKSLLNLDNFIQNNQTVSYQAEENTYFLFNKVPNTSDFQNPSDELLSATDIRSIFTYPLTYIVPFIDEFIEQQARTKAFVTEKNSLIGQYIVGLFRLLNGSASISYLMREANTYQSCISGTLLSRIYPYLEDIQHKVATKLFINPADVNIYVEQNEQNFRIRIRLTSLGQKLLGIRSDIPFYRSVPTVKSEHPSTFEPKNLIDSFRTVSQVDREATYTLSFKSIFTFDDSFYSNPVAKLNPTLPIVPIKNNFPSPILFPQRNEIAEIPTLSNIIGLIGLKKNILFQSHTDIVNKHGVSPVYIPTELPLSFNLEAKIKTRFNSNNRYLTLPPVIKSEIKLTPFYDYIIKNLTPYSIFDIFARDKKFEFSSDFGLRKTNFFFCSDGIHQLPTGKFSLINEDFSSSRIELLVPKEDTSNIASIAIAKYNLNIENKYKIELDSNWSDNTQKQKTDSPKLYEQSSFTFHKPEFNQKNIVWNLQTSAPKFGIYARNVKNEKIMLNHNLFVDTERNLLVSPKTYELDISKQVFKAGFISKTFRPLPSSINLEDVMMEYRYRIQVREEIPDLIFDEKRLKGEEYKPELNTKFEHKYMEPDLLIRRRSTYQKPLMYQIFKLGKLKVSNKVIVNRTDYKVAYNEIFPVIFFPKAIEIPVTRKLRQPVWASEEIKEFNELNPFRIQVSPLKVLRGEVAQYNTELPEHKHRYSKFFEPDFKDLKVSMLVNAPKKPAFAEDYLKYPKLPLIGAENIKSLALDSDIEFRDNSELNIDSTFDSELAPPDIFIEKMRFRTEKFFAYGWNIPSTDIIKFSTDIHMRTPLKIQTIIHHDDKLIIDKIKSDIRPKYPVRVKTLKLINNFTNLNDHKPHYEFTFKLADAKFDLFIPKTTCQNQDNNIIQKPLEQEFISPKLISRYILKKIAAKPPFPKLSRGKFFVIPEKAIDILFKHLLWEFSDATGPTLCEFNSNIPPINNETRIDNFDIKYKFIPIPTNVEFRPHEDITLRLSRVFIRKPYRIQNNHIKDLLALAKAQSAKATELISASSVSNL